MSDVCNNQTRILEVKDLFVSFTEEKSSLFDKKKKIDVLNGISFDMYEGEIVGLVGESGCGKSTLAKSILGLNKITKGDIIHYSQYPQMIFQDPYNSLNPSKTIEFILEESLKNLTKLNDEERRQKAKKRLEQVGLDDHYLIHKPGELSGGQRQRVCIANALMLDPKLLIADEPVSALDVTIQAQIIKLLAGLQKELGLSIIFISHDLRVVYELCDRVMIMKDGKIIEDGTVDEVYRNPQTDYTKQLLLSAGIM